MKKNKKSYFTLLEIAVAMAVFAILMLILMQIFSGTQNVWRRTTTKADINDSARNALRIITTALQSAVYLADPVGKQQFYYHYNSSTNTSLLDAGSDGNKKPILWVPSYLPNNLNDERLQTRRVEASFFLKKTNSTPDLYSLFVSYTLDINDSGSHNDLLDYKSDTATTDPYRAEILLLENIVDLKLRTYYLLPTTKIFKINASRVVKDKVFDNTGAETAANDSTTTPLPPLVELELKVLDSDPANVNRYKQNPSDDYTYTFTRLIDIKVGRH